MTVPASSRLRLHEAKTTFLYWVVPLFSLMACVQVALNLWLPVMAWPVGERLEAGFWIWLGVAALVSLAIPAGAASLFLFIPSITTALDPSRRMVVMEYQRPCNHRTVTEYPLAELHDLRAVPVRRRRYALALVLRSGQPVRLDYGLRPREAQARQAADAIKARLAPTGPRAPGEWRSTQLQTRL